MAASAVVDSALTDRRRSKRKIKEEGGSNEAGPSVSPVAAGSAGRLRSDGAGGNVGEGSATSPSRRAGALAGEPARGEEDNLIGQEWRAKRRKQAAAGPSASDAPDAVDTVGSISVADAKAASAAAFPRHNLPYPIGLTPFRYPCLAPHLPPPPPGDPSAPGFKPFAPDVHAAAPAGDAHANAHSASLPPGELDLSNLSDFASFADGIDLASFGAPHSLADASGSTTRGAGANVAQPASGASGATAQGPSSAMTAAPDGSLGFAMPDFAGLLPLDSMYMLGMPASPGERSDGGTAPMSPATRARYTLAPRADCQQCREGVGGHAGHWIKAYGR